MAALLLIGGALVALVGYVWILITAVMENILWGVGIFFLNPLALVYGVLKWEELKVPTLLVVGGVALHVLGRVLS